MKSYPIKRASLKLIDVAPFHAQALANAAGLRAWLFTVLPRHVALPLRRELRSTWVRWKTRHTHDRFSGAKNLRVNIGCADTGRDGWVNVDIVQLPGVTCVYDCRHHLPFDDDSVRLLFTEHFFEHIDYTEDVPFFLSECLRVMQPGGTLRIIVPDVEKYIRAYVERDWNELARVSTYVNEEHVDELYGSHYSTLMEALNFIFRQGGEHLYAWDYDTLAFVLRRYGFTDIQRRSYGESRVQELAIDRPLRASESLYVEAVKPDPTADAARPNDESVRAD